MRAMIDLADGTAMPLLGLGVWQVPDGPQCVHAVRAALELGYRHIDTAQAYGNERSVGRALRESGIARERGVRHHEVQPRAARPAQRGRREHRGARGRLRRPVPRPLAGRRGDVGLARDGSRARAQLRAGDRRLQLRPRRARPADRRRDGHDRRSTRSSSTPRVYRRALLDACAERGVGLEAYSPLGTGALLRDPVVDDVADDAGRTPAQVLLRWCVQRGIPVLAKSTHRERIAENARVFDFELSAEAMQRLDALDRTGGHPSRPRAQMVVITASPRSPLVPR